MAGMARSWFRFEPSLNSSDSNARRLPATDRASTFPRQVGNEAFGSPGASDRRFESDGGQLAGPVVPKVDVDNSTIASWRRSLLRQHPLLEDERCRQVDLEQPNAGRPIKTERPAVQTGCEEQDLFTALGRRKPVGSRRRTEFG